MEHEIEPGHRFGFDGRWREFAPIALSNLLLTIVTLGIYRFWALRREREYLWSKTWFLDDWLEWTGTGKELFIGFLMAMILLGGPLLILQFGIQRLIFEGYQYIAMAVTIIMLLFLNSMIGVARFRALRYRLVRTYWKGIRGGSDEPGWAYGLSNMWKWGANYLSLGTAIAWTMVSLWNDRWNKMSFGNMPFRADARVRPILKPFIFLYLIPILLFILGVGAAISQGVWSGNVYIVLDAPPLFRIIHYLVVALFTYLLISAIFLIYYAAFYREAVSQLSLNGLRFSFEAEGGDWMMLFLVDAAIILGTLGVGWFFLGYRHWAFFAKHLAVHGDLDQAALAQSQTVTSRYGEGLLDAMDVGAF